MLPLYSRLPLPSSENSVPELPFAQDSAPLFPIIQRPLEDLRTKPEPIGGVRREGGEVGNRRSGDREWERGEKE